MINSLTSNDGYYSASNINNLTANDGYYFASYYKFVEEDNLKYKVVYNEYTGCQEYYYNNKLHRLSGPAIDSGFFSNSNMWYYHGIHIPNVKNKENFNRKVKSLILK